MKNVLAALAAAAMLGLPSLALAHTGHGGAAAGFLHPFTGIDHLFALLALGVLASQLRNARALLLVSAFAVAFATAFLFAQSGIMLPAQEPMLAASLVGLGALIFLGSRVQFWPAMALTTVFAAYHGGAHGGEITGSGAASALPGLMAACLLLTGGSYVLGRLLSGRTGAVALRYQQASAAISMLTGLVLLT